jgi:alcohol dehydrogenase class IV/quinol monooxygenase YgiN
MNLVCYAFAFTLLLQSMILRSLAFRRTSFLCRSALSLQKGSFAMSTSSACPTSPIFVSLWNGKVSDASLYRSKLQAAAISLKEPGFHRVDLMRGLDDQSDFLFAAVHDASVSSSALTQLAADSLQPQPRVYEAIYPAAKTWTNAISATTINAVSNNPDSYIATYPWHLKPYEINRSASGVQKGGLFAVFVDIQVVTGKEDEFIQHTLNNCQSSHLESGVHRFDFLRNSADPNNFILVEIYNSDDAPIRHKQTAHYHTWAKAVMDMMARPRTATKYMTLFPTPLDYHKSSEIIYPGEAQSFLNTHINPSPTDSAFTAPKGLSTAINGMFSFQGPRIVMGRGIAQSALLQTITTYNMKRPLIVTGRSGPTRYQELLHAVFSKSFPEYMQCIQTIDGEPTVEDAIRVRDFAAFNNCDSILSIGGGSAIDLGKAIAALLPNKHRDIFDFLEVIGKGLPLENDPLPFVAVPTTSGTGSEATKNAVLKSAEHGRKVSIRHDKMFPVAAILDPTLTLSCPPDVTAHVGMDTLCQVLEPYLCNAPNPFTDALAKEGITRAARSLRNAVCNGQHDIEAREDMAIASVMGGLCLANARLGTVHGFAAVLGGMFEDAPHGAICAILLPFVFEKNVKALTAIINDTSGNTTLQEKVDAGMRLHRFQEVSQMMTNNPQATIDDGVAWLHALLHDINIPPLSALCRGITEEQFAVIVANTKTASSTKGNPVKLDDAALLDIIQMAL